MTAAVSRKLDASREATRDAAREAIEAWGGDWTEEGDQDRVRIPVQAGLRHALAVGRLRVEPGDTSSRLELELEPISWRVHRPAVAVLVPATLAGVAVVFWPFFPSLGAFVPLGLLIGLGAWFLVVSRVQNRGPEELLATIEAILGEGRGRGER